VTDSVPSATDPGHDTGHKIRWSRGTWMGLAVVGITFVIAATVSWRKCTAVVYDFGTELYIPWRLSQGAVLYRDLFFFAGGPLSQYYNALLFKAFGVSFLTLIFSNLAAVCLMLLVIYRRFLAAADAWTATTICLGIILIFAFEQAPIYENYNYAAPYSHEALHGLVLSVFAVALLSDWIIKQRIYFALLAGFCSGLVFLTKPDIFMALTACDVAAFAIFFFSNGKAAFAIKSLAAFAVAAIIPPLCFFFYFLRVENWPDSLHSVVFGWVPLFYPAIIKNANYQWCLGLNHPLFYLRQMCIHFLVIIGVTAFYAAAFRAVANRKPDWEKIQRRAVPALLPVLITLIYADSWHQAGESFSSSFAVVLLFLWIFITLLVVLLNAAIIHWKLNVYKTPWAIVLMLATPLLAVAYTADWHDCGASLPLVGLLTCAVIFWNRKNLALEQRFVFPFLWTVFALFLLSKLGFFPRVWHYGFALGMPAFVGAVYFLLWLLPRVLERKWKVSTFFFRSTAWLVLIIGFRSLFLQSEKFYAQKTLAVGSGNDQVFTYNTLENGIGVNETLAWIAKNTPKNATLAALPEGANINYLSRRIDPTPCVFLDPNIFSIFSEAKITAAFEKTPPDYILIIERNNPTLDIPYFGTRSYGKELIQFIQKNYQTELLIGHEPLKNGLFGIKILKRLQPSAAPVTSLSTAKL
jgi:hypothetical protein